jgi:hypothetical protein
MDIIDAFIGWKRFWRAQTSVAHAKQAFVDTLVIRLEGKLGLRRLGKRDTQEPSRATNTDPGEGCIIKMGFWRGTTDAAESTGLVGCSLFLYYEGFKRRSEGEERLVGEQDHERAKYVHFLEAETPGVSEPHQGGPVTTLYGIELAQPLSVTAGWARGTPRPKHDIHVNLMTSGLNCRR